MYHLWACRFYLYTEICGIAKSSSQPRGLVFVPNLSWEGPERRTSFIDLYIASLTQNGYKLVNRNPIGPTPPSKGPQPELDGGLFSPRPACPPQPPSGKPAEGVGAAFGAEGVGAFGAGEFAFGAGEGIAWQFMKASIFGGNHICPPSQLEPIIEMCYIISIYIYIYISMLCVECDVSNSSSKKSYKKLKVQVGKMPFRRWFVPHGDHCCCEGQYPQNTTSLELKEKLR